MNGFVSGVLLTIVVVFVSDVVNDDAHIYMSNRLVKPMMPTVNMAASLRKMFMSLKPRLALITHSGNNYSKTKKAFNYMQSLNELSSCSRITVGKLSATEIHIMGSNKMIGNKITVK